MIRSLLLTLLLTTAAQAQLTLQVSSFPPGKELKPGVAAILTLEGLQAGQTAIWHNSPIEGDVFLQFGDKMLFGGTSSGLRTVVVQIPAIGVDPFVVHSFKYGGNEVNPPEPGIVEKVVILYESGTKTHRQAMCLNGLESYLSKRDYLWAIRDKDTKDGLTNLPPTWLLPYLQAVKTYPAIVIKVGNKYEAFPLSNSSEEGVELIRRYGG